MQPKIRRAFRKRLRDAGSIGARAAKAKIREWPATGGRYSVAGHGRHFRARPAGLRSTLAANITVTAGRSNVAIRQRSRGLSGHNARDLPRDIDRGGWWHPVYGHHATKVFQTGWPYFKDEISGKRDEMLSAV